MSNFALYNVNKHSMQRQKREESPTGICHVGFGQESKASYDFKKNQEEPKLKEEEDKE